MGDRFRSVHEANVLYPSFDIYVKNFKARTSYITDGLLTASMLISE